MRIPATAALFAAFALAACTTDGTLLGDAKPSGQGALSYASSPETTGSLGSDIDQGKTHFKAGRFELAEKSFHRAAEAEPKNVQAWLGLAAAYDKLRVFSFADRAYERAIAIDGPTAEILNNQGYSYLLRGDLKNAREKLAAAKAKAPDNPYVKSNLEALAKVSGKASANLPAGR